MDRISDSDSEDAGSIPAGATNEGLLKVLNDVRPVFFNIAHDCFFNSCSCSLTSSMVFDIQLASAAFFIG
jgi:hypothetical protein